MATHNPEPGVVPMILEVEFLGLARDLSRTSRAQVQLDDHATWRDLIRYLGIHYPSLIGQVITPVVCDLTSSYMLNLGGRRVVRNLDVPAQAGARVLLMFAEAGG